MEDTILKFDEILQASETEHGTFTHCVVEL